MLSSLGLSAQTFFGMSSAPVDNGAQAGNVAVAIVPPALMQAGDLVIIYAHYRNTSGTFSVSTTGGQTWNTGATNTGANQRYFIAWCRFNGTWGSNPAVTISGGVNTIPLTAVMYVYRPTNPSRGWVVNVAQTNTTNNTAALQTITGVTTTASNTVTMAFWSSNAAHTWGTLNGAGWNKPVFPLLATQVRNTTGSDISHTAAYIIMASAGATGNVEQTASAVPNTVRSIMSWREINDNCTEAIPVTVNSGTSCTSFTTGNTISATQSLAGCTGTADDDVWFSFVATRTSHSITATPSGGTPISNIVLQVFASCGGASLICVNNTTGAREEIATLYNLTIGTTYFYRVHSQANGSGQGEFTTCVTDPIPATVVTGKSFINISRPGGGTIVPGDELEIRLSVNVTVTGTNLIYRLRYNDTLPSNVTYVPGSLRLLTNEAKVYASYTDAAGDDAAMYNNIDRTIRFNLGRDTTNMARGVVSTTSIDSTTGGYVNSSQHVPRGNGLLVLVTYRVIVDASTPLNTIINYPAGMLRYRNTLSSVGALDYELASNTLSFITYPNYGLCSDATGVNNVNLGSGNFGSGTAHNGANPGTVPGYNYVSIATSNPGDGNYVVVKNLSPSESTNPLLPRPQSPSVDRVFGVWDIIGDHTGAADPLAGNPPSPNGANGGYMLAVNAAYQLSVANNQIITGLCENTYYEFSAWFRNVCKRCGIDSNGRGASGVVVNPAYIPTAPGDSSGVKPNLTFQINGTDYYVSGDIDYSGAYGQWVKKGFVFMTGPGQTSVTISIKNNAPGGGGNDWVMDDIEFRTCLPDLTMRPNNAPTYCRNGSIDLSVAVSSFYNNYLYYQWERSTDGGATWHSAPEMPGLQTFSYTNFGSDYRDTVAVPTFIANSSMDGYMYRIRTATAIGNMSNDNCSIYNSTDIITINIDPDCVPLNAEVLNFNIRLNNSKAQLAWYSRNEDGLLRYEVEKSKDGRNFSYVGTVTAKGSGSASYLFNDAEDISTKTYYRLKLVSNNTSTYSNILSVSNIKSAIEITNLINPFGSEVSFQLLTSATEEVQVQVLDALGHQIISKKMMVNKGSNAIRMELPVNLQRATYLLRVVSASGTINRIIQKH